MILNNQILFSFGFGVTLVTVNYAPSHLRSFYLSVPGDPEPSKCSSDLSKQAVESEKISKEDIDKLNKKVSTLN